VGKPIHNILTH